MSRQEHETNRAVRDIMYNNNTSNIDIKTVAKRKREDAFGYGTNDEERYGQIVADNFFKINTGHNVIQILSNDINFKSPLNSEAEIMEWCYKFLSSKVNTN